MPPRGTFSNALFDPYYLAFPASLVVSGRISLLNPAAYIQEGQVRDIAVAFY